MAEVWLALRLLLLLAVANVAPILTKRVLGSRWAVPLDGGLCFFDGRPLLGPSKTVRGLVAAIVATGIAAPLLDIPVALGALVGATAMAGDACASFIKRRLGVETSGQATGLDQIPEALLPLLAVQAALDLSLLQIVGVTLVFFALQPPFARLFHLLGLRDTPH